MFVVLNIKKILVPAAAALLFLLITGIILSGSNEEILAVANISPAGSGPVLIIDAGHGGTDGGAVAANGITESSINLAVSQKLEAAAKLFGIQTVMTRSSEALNYPEEAESIHEKKVWDQQSRAELINSIPNAVLISIHQNTYPDPRPSGPQVLYGRVSGAEILGELAQTALTENVAPENRRLAAPISENIYLMKSSNCPAILVECGFISNEKELNLLLDDSYQCKLAAILLSSYIQYMNLSPGGNK